MKKLSTLLLATALTLPAAAAFADDHGASETGSANTKQDSMLVEEGNTAANESGKVHEDAKTNTESGSANTKQDSMLTQGGSAQTESAMQGKVEEQKEDHDGVSPQSGSANTDDGSMLTK